MAPKLAKDAITNQHCHSYCPGLSARREEGNMHGIGVSPDLDLADTHKKGACLHAEFADLLRASSVLMLACWGFCLPASVPRWRPCKLWERGACAAERLRHSVLGLNVHSLISSCACVPALCFSSQRLFLNAVMMSPITAKQFCFSHAPWP